MAKREDVQALARPPLESERPVVTQHEREALWLWLLRRWSCTVYFNGFAVVEPR